MRHSHGSCFKLPYENSKRPAKWEMRNKKLQSELRENYAISVMLRSWHKRCYIKKAGLKNFSIFTRKHLDSLFIKLLSFYKDLPACNFIEKILQHSCFFWEYWNFLRAVACNFIKKRFQHKYFPVNISCVFAATDMRYFIRSKFRRSLVPKKNFSSIWQVVFSLGYVFCQKR